MEISTSRRLPWALIGIALSVLFILLSIPKKWEDAARTGEGGALVLTDDWTRAVERKQEQYAEHELYALLAARAGYYQCGHCPGGRFFLKEMEVYRYGVTGLGQQGRGYSDSWLSRQALSYNMILTADLTTVKMQEAALIGVPDEKWGEVGLMVVVLKPDQKASEAELRDFCATRLARYKVPKRVEFVDALPYSPYGKVMKLELKQRFVET